MSKKRRCFTDSSRTHYTFLAAFFSLCSCVGLVWGLLVRTPHYPSMGDIALYPGARGVETREVKPTGLASPLPTQFSSSTPDLRFTNFGFQTEDTSEAIRQFYIKALTKTYGFQLWKEEAPDTNTTTLYFVRDTTVRIGAAKAGYDKEFVTVTITRDGAGETAVEVSFRVEEFVKD